VHPGDATNRALAVAAITPSVHGAIVPGDKK
jgi:hypothetical protein